MKLVLVKTEGSNMEKVKTFVKENKMIVFGVIIALLVIYSFINPGSGTPPVNPEL